ncbi:MAG: M20 family metallopeptidase [Tissierellia bacterium]|nr:M20 family metallopeptidase [Tissierellia bacterium]
MNNIIKEVEDNMDEVIENRRYLHKNPEIGFSLDNTISFVKKKLDEYGIDYRTDIGKSAVVATINPGKGRVIALRADMDALPIKEETGLEFQSENGNMHACGHDGHTSMLLGAAKILNNHKDEINGTVKLIFQPAEELGTGSKYLCEDGVMDDVDEIIGLHAGNITDEGPTGSMVFSKGSMMACMDKFTIEVKGVAAHGSTPQLSVDPVLVGSHIVVALQEIISREMDPRTPAVITTGIFKSGSAFNIIPEKAQLEGTVRAITDEDRKYIAKRIEEVSTTVAKAFRADVTYEYFWQPPPVVNDKHVAEKLMAVAKDLYPDNVIEMQKPVMGGEDFAWYLEEKPGSFFLLQNPLKIDGKVWPHHNSKFALDESQFGKGISVMVGYVLSELS